MFVDAKVETVAIVDTKFIRVWKRLSFGLLVWVGALPSKMMILWKRHYPPVATVTVAKSNTD